MNALQPGPAPAPAQAGGKTIFITREREERETGRRGRQGGGSGGQHLSSPLHFTFYYQQRAALWFVTNWKN